MSSPTERSEYPKGTFYSVYEAGFCGFWIHHKLEKLGIRNIVVNPADVPTSNKEKCGKTDTVDSGKLAKELENRNLTSIHVPSLEEQTLKSLCRYRITLGSDITRIKNRISGYMNLFGREIPDETRWTGAFIKKLYILAEQLPNGETLMRLTDSLKSKKNEILQATRDLKTASKRSGKWEFLKLLQTVPGIGFLTAAVLMTELSDIRRFPNFDSLASYVGLVPSIRSSGDKEIIGGLTNRRHRLIIKMMIEASWVAVRKDPAILKSFSELTKRMKKQKAIIRIAKKLLNRIRAVWLQKTEYKLFYN